MNKRPDKIEFFKEHDNSRTAFSAGVMNEMIAVLNAFLSMRGVNGVRVHWSDSGPVIDANVNVTGSGGSGTTIINETNNIINCLSKYA
jgi:hypothetical protein